MDHVGFRPLSTTSHHPWSSHTLHAMGKESPEITLPAAESTHGPSVRCWRSQRVR